MFWDAKGVILLDFLYQGTINATRYSDTLTKFRSAVRRKRPGLLSEGVVLLDDNVLSGRHFQNNAEMEQAVRQFLASQGTEF